MTQKLQEEYGAVREAAESDGQWCKHEKAKLNFDHVEVGVALLEQWNFPRELVEAIALHHQEPEAATDRPPTLAQLIWLANILSNSLAGKHKASVDRDWPKLFAQASITWDATKIAEFFATFEEQLAQERWLFSEGS
jgi:HD-like signal output (HDOD) protein